MYYRHLNYLQQLKKAQNESWQLTSKSTKFCKEYKRTSTDRNIPIAENTIETQMKNCKHWTKEKLIYTSSPLSSPSLQCPILHSRLIRSTTSTQNLQVEPLEVILTISFKEWKGSYFQNTIKGKKKIQLNRSYSNNPRCRRNRFVSYPTQFKPIAVISKESALTVQAR